ncbi:MAG TPA: EAL domain-containing protein [Azospira sp.]|nr:EAL domain-containing protein [Azospira sp.]
MGRVLPYVLFAAALVGAALTVVFSQGHYGLSWLTLALFLAATLVGAREIARLRQAAHVHELVMEGAHGGIWAWNPVTKKLHASPRLLAILGYPENSLTDSEAWLALMHPDDVARYSRAVADHLKGITDHFYCEYRVRHHNGDYRWIASRGIAVRNRHGVATLMAGSVTEITERKQDEERIHYLAHHDQLTGLPNRLLLAVHLPQALRRAKREGSRVAVLFVDLDRFKNINDSLGHNVGDRILHTAAGRLRQALRESDSIVRQGGDEFIVILSDLQSSAQAAQVGAKLLEAVAQPYQEGDHAFFLTASIGVAVYPDDGKDMDTLLRNADTAMYAGKSAGGNTVHFYTGALNERLQSRVYVERRLHQALDNGEFSLYYQPQIDIASGRLVGAEALLRWHDGEQMVPPDSFIPIAEESGLIVPIGQWVLDTAIAQAAAWHRAWGERQGLPPRIAINLSARQFWGGGLAEHILERLGAEGLPASAIELEITESVLLRQEGDSLAELRRLEGSGLGLSLDDFGTGYSSLSYLRLLPIDTLKIDKSFIAALDEHTVEAETSDALAIVRAIIAMAHSLNFQVVAEGVESTGQLALLRDLNCDSYQGYLESRPLPAAEFAARYLG